MEFFSTPAVLLRRIDYGDDDVIATFFTLTHGKIPLLAKYARRSVKRFGGVLDFFSVLNIVFSKNRGRIPILKEASPAHPYEKIRSDIKKTAYAGYWTELIAEWTEERHPEPGVYSLFVDMLRELNSAGAPPELLSIAFQMRFACLTGIEPVLKSCVKCESSIETISDNPVAFDMEKGGLICSKCRTGSNKPFLLSRGSVMRLNWIANGDIERIRRIRCSEASLAETDAFAEAFIVYRIGKKLKSLDFLTAIRER